MTASHVCCRLTPNPLRDVNIAASGLNQEETALAGLVRARGARRTSEERAVDYGSSERSMLSPGKKARVLARAGTGVGSIHEAWRSGRRCG